MSPCELCLQSRCSRWTLDTHFSCLKPRCLGRVETSLMILPGLHVLLLHPVCQPKWASHILLRPKMALNIYVYALRPKPQVSSGKVFCRAVWWPVALEGLSCLSTGVQWHLRYPHMSKTPAWKLAVLVQGHQETCVTVSQNHRFMCPPGTAAEGHLGYTRAP